MRDKYRGFFSKFFFKFDEKNQTLLFYQFLIYIAQQQIKNSKMPIFASMIAVQNPETKQVIILQRDYELSSVSFMIKNQVKNSFKFLVRQSFACLDKHTRNSVVHEDKLCHIQKSSKPIAAYAFVGKEYNQKERVIFAYLNKILEIFIDKVGDNWKQYKTDQNLEISQIGVEFKRYQDPTNVDKLSLAQAKVDETKIVLYDSVKKLLETQGDLDKLVEKSKDLSEGAKQFYKTSNKMDKSCCQLI